MADSVTHSSEAIGTSSSSPSSNYSYPLWVSWFGNDIESSCFKSSIQCALSISLNWNQEHLARSTSSSWRYGIVDIQLLSL